MDIRLIWERLYWALVKRFLKKSGIQLAAGYRFSFIFTDQGISNEA